MADWTVLRKLKNSGVDIGGHKVVMNAGREILTTVVNHLPALFAPITTFLDPILIELTRRTGVEVFPRVPAPKLLAAATEPAAGS